MHKLANQWRQEAKRFRAASEGMGEDEWFLCNTEADRLERCADELEAELSVIAQHIREKHSGGA